MACRGKLLVVLAVTWAAMAGPVLALPHWSSDQFRAARPLAAQEAVVFDLRTEVTQKGKPAQVTLTTVTLAPSFTEMTTGESHLLDDYSLCRTLHWSDNAKVVGDTSCYAQPAFRAIELRNRQALAQMLAKGGAKFEQSANPYWDEAALGLQFADEARLTPHTSGDTTEYRLDKIVAVKISGDAGQLSPDERRRLVRYLAGNVGLHPQVRRGLAQQGRLPARIESQGAELGVVQSTTVMTLSNLRRAPVPYPLPAGLGSELRDTAAKGRTARDAGVRSALLAIDGAASPARPTLRELIDGVKTTKDPMQAYLLFLNLTQQYGAAITGPDSQALLVEIRPAMVRLFQDPSVIAFSQASDLAGDPRKAGDRQAAARFLSQAGQMDTLRFGTFRNVTYANLVGSARDIDTWDRAIAAAMPATPSDNYWVHIAAYPWASNAYKDVGDSHFRQFATPDAWLAYDLGRAVDPDWRTGMMGNVEKLEARLRAQAPDFF